MTTIKVKRLDLIARLTKVRDEQNERLRKEFEEYAPIRKRDWEQNQLLRVPNLEHRIEQLTEDLKRTKAELRKVKAEAKKNVYVPPVFTPRTDSQLDREIRLLEMSDQEVINVSHNTSYFYFL